jgi:hypothetical protein
MRYLSVRRYPHRSAALAGDQGQLARWSIDPTSPLARIVPG